jgi:hypothetical protein
VRSKLDPSSRHNFNVAVTKALCAKFLLARSREKRIKIVTHFHEARQHLVGQDVTERQQGIADYNSRSRLI